MAERAVAALPRRDHVISHAASPLPCQITRSRPEGVGVLTLAAGEEAQDPPLRVFDEPHHPRLQQYTHQHTKGWSAAISRADAFVFATPDHNHSFPGLLKNALDYLSVEWADKAAGIVSYGGVSAGLRAATALKPVLAALRMVPVVEAVSIPFFAQFLAEDDEFAANAELEAGAKGMLDELLRLTSALSSLRTTA